MKKYTITCTEEQLRLIAFAMEDWHRFIAGECRMFNATCYIKPAEDMHYVRDEMENLVHPYLTPMLGIGSSYKWDGGTCPNEHQRRDIAMSYGIYRQIQHFFALQHPENTWNTLLSETLTCEEQGPLIQIEEVKDARQE